MNKFQHVRGGGEGSLCRWGRGVHQVNKFEYVCWVGGGCRGVGIACYLWLTNGINGSGHIGNPTVDRQTDITFPLLCWRVVNIRHCLRSVPDIINLFCVCRETVADQLFVETVTTITFRWESPRGASPDAAPASRLCTPMLRTSSTGSARTVADASKFVQWKSMIPQINVQFHQTSFQFYSLKRKSEYKKKMESISENQPKFYYQFWAEFVSQDTSNCEKWNLAKWYFWLEVKSTGAQFQQLCHWYKSMNFTIISFISLAAGFHNDFMRK